MEKHELLKLAYDNYPKGIRFVPFIDGGTYTSSGKFELNPEDYDSITDAENGHYVYEYGRWAKILEKPVLDFTFDCAASQSILTGMCAIQVNNEREFKLLMEHYESKGWRWCTGRIPTYYKISQLDDFGGFPNLISFKDKFNHDAQGYELIAFADFAKEVGITPPVFVMTSEDGVPLYTVDQYYNVVKLKDWAYKGKFTVNSRMSPLTRGEEYKAFSTPEAAEEWIAKANRKPLITSVDGVELFKGDFFWVVVRENLKLDWHGQSEKTDGDKHKFKLSEYKLSNEKYAIFSTRKAAEDFIVKNKKILICGSSREQLYVTKKGMEIVYDGVTIFFQGKWLLRAEEKFKSLQDDQA